MTVGAQPRVLLLDIETAPNIVTSWGLWVNGPLGHENILKERFILCAAWKWLEGSKVHTEKAKVGDRYPDKGILKKLHKALETADAVVAHNGDSFDIPWLMARFIVQGFAPAKPVIQIDTKKIAKDKFYFNNNRLDYLGRYLGLGKKIKTDYDLWLEAMRGSKDHLRKMVAYNTQDVLLLEKVYLKLRPFFPAKLNRALFVEDADTASRTCPACGKDALRAEGYSYTRTGKRRNYVCGTRSRGKLTPGSGCGHWCYRLVAAPERPKGTIPR